MPRTRPVIETTNTDQRDRGQTAAKKAVEYGIRSGKNVFCMFELPDTDLEEQYQFVCSVPPEQFAQFYLNVILPQCLKRFPVTETRAELDQTIDTFRARSNLGITDYNLVEAGPGVGTGKTKQDREYSNILHNVAVVLDSYAETNRPDLRSSTQSILREVNAGDSSSSSSSVQTTASAAVPMIDAPTGGARTALLPNRRFYIECDPKIHEAYWPNAWFDSAGVRDPSAIEPILYNGFSKSSTGEKKRVRPTAHRPAKRRRKRDS